MILHDELDIALVNMEMYNIDKMDSCILLHDKLVFCVAENHALAHKESITVEDLNHEKIILFNKDSVQNTLLKSRFEAHNIRPNIIMQGSQLYTIINFIRNGDCGCFLYESTMAGLMKFRSIPLDPVMHTDIGLVWKKGRYVTSQMSEFIEFAKGYWN